MRNVVQYFKKIHHFEFKIYMTFYTIEFKKGDKLNLFE